MSEKKDQKVKDLGLAIATAALLSVTPAGSLPASVNLDEARQLADAQISASADADGNAQVVLNSVGETEGVEMSHSSHSSHASHASHASHSSHRSSL